MAFGYWILRELSWEILRYRSLKKWMLDAHRAAVVEAILQRLDGEGMPSEAMNLVRIQATADPLINFGLVAAANLAFSAW